jgi:hypothetical protein
MEKVPPSFNIEKLLNKELTGICFSSNTISIYFTTIGSIVIYGSFSFDFENEVHEFDEIYPIDDDFRLLKLLGQSVISINLNDDRTNVCFIFSNHAILELFGNSHYESFEINIDGNICVI